MDEARKFLESSRNGHDPLYALWVLILVLGLRRGEALGLVWPAVDIDNAEISLEWQLQRVGKQLIHKKRLKADGSTDVLPLPPICLTALKLRKADQDNARARDWPRNGLVFTTRNGKPIEPPITLSIVRRETPNSLAISSTVKCSFAWTFTISSNKRVVRAISPPLVP